MGIQRKAFEAYMADRYKNTVDQRVCINSDGDYMAWDMQVARHVWQAAKASVPEGFVLVKTADIAKLAIAVSRVDLMTYSEARPDSEKLAWQNVANKLEAMIEAQEPAND